MLREYPATKRIFDSLFVNIPCEGCDCLDEVAWRRGMEAQDLINKLEAVISSCACQKQKASTLTEAAAVPEEAGVTT